MILRNCIQQLPAHHGSAFCRFRLNSLRAIVMPARPRPPRSGPKHSMSARLASKRWILCASLQEATEFGIPHVICVQGPSGYPGARCWQAFSADWNRRLFGSKSLGMPGRIGIRIPLAVGSGKSLMPWARMHTETLSN